MRLQFLKSSLEYQIRRNSCQIQTINRLLSGMTPIHIKGEEESTSRTSKVSVSSFSEGSCSMNVKHEVTSSAISEEEERVQSEMESENVEEGREESEKENREDERKDERLKEDMLGTQRFQNSSEETIVYRVNEEEKKDEKEEVGEAMEVDEIKEESKKETDEEKEKGEVIEETIVKKSNSVPLEDILEDMENNADENKEDYDSDDSQTLTADSKTPIADNLSQSLLIPQDLSSEALALKKKLLDDSSTSEKSADSLESSSSDSDLSSGEVLKKLSSSAKKRARNNNNSSKKKINISDEDKELKRLTNLNSLRTKRKLNFGKEDEDDEEEDSEPWLKKQGVEKVPRNKKPKENGTTLLDMLNGSDDSEKEICVKEEEFADPLKQFWRSNNDMLKEIVLASSGSSSDTESAKTSDSIPVEEKKKKPSKKARDDSDSSRKERPSWKNDPLLRNNLFSDSDDEIWKDKKKDDSDVIIESSDEKDGTDVDKKQKKKKKPMKHKDSDILSTDSSDNEEEHISPVKSQETPSKGRKNIRHIFKKDSLQLSTRQALDMEKNRKKRLEERQKVYSELFPPSEDTLVLDYDPVSKKPLLSVHKKLVQNLKPHQREGVKFMWDSCFESLKRLEEESGSGCILAHCMGLGKTLQAIALTHSLLTNNTGVRTILIVCPMNTVSNWRNEFRQWLKNLHGKRIDVYDLNKYKKYFQRSYKLSEWHEKGGVMIISYDMFRILTNDLKNSPLKNHVRDFERALLDPGPDLVICDEGHKIKNDNTALSKCMRRIKTSRRVVLTGTPLQNNLNEYYWMVNFIKPNILGSVKEFRNRFLNPITNGQFKDSTTYDVNLMKKRSHVLHTMLDGCIQRYDYRVLTPFLPEKHEYVINVCLTKTQATLYEHYLKNFSKRSESVLQTAKIFKDYNCLLRVWTHPYTLRAHSGKEAKTNEKNHNTFKAIENEEVPIGVNEDWWKGLVPDEEFEDVHASNKLTLLFSVLAKCEEIGDKVLLFSTSLYALEMIEHFLNKKNWVENHDYFKLTGATNSDNRTRCCKLFNQKDNKRARLFLISTRAGGLGINLVGANRVILFDASWNPSNDVQSIFRVYRFGQKKPCYIYRFLAEATMEEKIYLRQVTKLSLADRVVDEHQIERHYTIGNLHEMYNYNPSPPEVREKLSCPKDKLLADILQKHTDVIVNYHEHDSLLENKQEEELTEEERQAAWEEFEKEKFYENRAPPPVVSNLMDLPNPQDLVNQVATIYPQLDQELIRDNVLEMVKVFKNPMAQHDANDNSVCNIRIDKVESLSDKSKLNGKP